MLKLTHKFLVLAIFMVAGVILSGNANAECKEGEKRKTTTLAVFTCDTSHPALGEAWRDPDGLIWGDIVKNADGSGRFLVQSSDYLKLNGTLGAKEYCEVIGTRLPSEKEFIRLGEYIGYMGARPRALKEILPNFPYHSSFWSSSILDDDFGLVFNSSNGAIGAATRNLPDPVRCVVERE